MSNRKGEQVNTVVATTLEKKSRSFKKSSGHGGPRPGAGRKKGVPNKFTADVKEAIIEAFENAGGVKYLTGVAMSDPRVFCALLGKVIPTQITGENGGPLKITWGDAVAEADD